jgi:hypothetical protein
MFKKIGAEAILATIVIPVIFWFAGFVISSYNTFAEVNNQKEDLREIKQDVKDIKAFLITNGAKNGH